ncbi:MAG: 16S rRNA (cytidine(1402)-2'-O)-methyltransferase [Chloroflexota bacterium]|nr:16S rRNA (cytidine(1402)-2'-O)-methyltransferase [Chloroflexota bacterium]
MGTLYVVGTPIGNLEDITLRAARVLGEVSLVAAEDTRVSRRLLSHLGVRVPMVSCNEHNWQQRLPELLKSLSEGDVALVTDAGMPGVSDPGAPIVSAVTEEGFPVQVIPGPSAVTAALAVSGMPADAFLFLGFLPRRRKERRERLARVAAIRETLVAFEAPHRLRDVLSDLLQTLGDRNIAVCRELTKLHEEVWRGSVSGALEYFDTPRGEFVLGVAGAEDSGDSGQLTDPEVARKQLASLRQSGSRARDAVAQVTAATGLPRSEVYRLWLETSGDSAG